MVGVETKRPGPPDFNRLFHVPAFRLTAVKKLYQAAVGKGKQIAEPGNARYVVDCPPYLVVEFRQHRPFLDFALFMDGDQPVQGVQAEKEGQQEYEVEPAERHWRECPVEAE